MRFHTLTSNNNWQSIRHESSVPAREAGARWARGWVRSFHRQRQLPL